MKIGQGLYRAWGKRAIDIALSALSLPLVAIAAVCVGCAIKLDDGGPVFFRQTRRGLDGREFEMLKFRSMAVGAPDIRNGDSSTLASKDDSRVTRVGRIIRKTSIDELPQLLNVFVGDMSLVGPRPNLTTKPLDSLVGDERRRLAVKPGITGYNQAYFRNTSSLDDRYRNDCYYVDHCSFPLDVAIVGQTICSVFSQKGIYSRDSTEGKR